MTSIFTILDQSNPDNALEQVIRLVRIGIPLKESEEYAAHDELERRGWYLIGHGEDWKHNDRNTAFTLFGACLAEIEGHESWLKSFHGEPGL